MMDKALAITEASVIVQNCALLELQGSEYHIIPKWVVIFRRIFSWRLMSLSDGVHSLPYVLEHRSSVPASLKFAVDDSNTDASCALHDSDMYESRPTQPSLDEMIGVCYNPSKSERVHSKPEASRPFSSTGDDHGKEASYALTTTDNVQDEEENPPQEIVSTKTDDCRSREVMLAVAEDPEGVDKLSKLSKMLEQCILQQKQNNEKLSIYF